MRRTSLVYLSGEGRGKRTPVFAERCKDCDSNHAAVEFVEHKMIRYDQGFPMLL